MSHFVLDTDILSLFRKGHPEVCRQLSQHAGDRLSITVITVQEGMAGWYLKASKAVEDDDIARAYTQLAEMTRYLASWEILEYTQAAIQRYHELRKMKVRVKKLDLRIAAIVLENDSTLVTRNVRDFKRVPGLKIENWAG